MTVVVSQLYCSHFLVVLWLLSSHFLVVFKSFFDCLISIVPYQLSRVPLGWTYKTCTKQLYPYVMNFVNRILRFLQIVDFYSLQIFAICRFLQFVDFYNLQILKSTNSINHKQVANRPQTRCNEVIDKSKKSHR